MAEGLFVQDDVGVALVGSHCTGCGAHSFPSALSCRDPRCDVKQAAPALLGRTGTLYSWTVQHYRPPALFRMDPWQPYALGLVEVPEGLRVLGLLTGLPLDEVEIGMPLALVTMPLCTDADGSEVLTYAYAPVTS